MLEESSKRDCLVPGGNTQVGQTDLQRRGERSLKSVLHTPKQLRITDEVYLGGGGTGLPSHIRRGMGSEYGNC